MKIGAAKEIDVELDRFPVVQEQRCFKKVPHGDRRALLVTVATRSLMSQVGVFVGNRRLELGRRLLLRVLLELQSGGWC